MRYLSALLLILMLAATAVADRSNAVASMAFSPNGQKLAAGWWNGRITVHDLSGKRTRTTEKAHSDAVLGVAFRNDGSLVSWSADGSVRSGGKTTKTGPVIFKGALSPDGNRLAIVSDEIQLFDLKTGGLKNSERVSGFEVRELVWSQGGKRFAVCRGPHAILYDGSSGKRVSKLKKDAVFTVNALAFLPDGQLLTLDAHSLRRFEPVGGTPTLEMTGLALDKGSKIILAPGSSAVCILGADGGKFVGRRCADLKTKKHEPTLHSPVAAIDGNRYLAVVDETKLAVVTFAEGAVATPRNCSKEVDVYLTTVSPDGKHVAWIPVSRFGEDPRIIALP